MDGAAARFQGTGNLRAALPRDGKPRYLDDLPLVLRHATRVVERYDVFSPVARLLDRLHQRTPRTGFTF